MHRNTEKENEVKFLRWEGFTLSRFTFSTKHDVTVQLTYKKTVLFRTSILSILRLPCCTYIYCYWKKVLQYDMELTYMNEDWEIQKYFIRAFNRTVSSYESASVVWDFIHRQKHVTENFWNVSCYHILIEYFSRPLFLGQSCFYNNTYLSQKFDVNYFSVSNTWVAKYNLQLYSYRLLLRSEGSVSILIWLSPSYVSTENNWTLTKTS